MAAKIKTEKQVLEGALNPDPKELDKGAKNTKVEVSTPADHCDPLCQLTHLYSGHPVSAEPKKSAADKTVTSDPQQESTATITVPKATVDAACVALEVLKKASEAKS